MQGIWNDCQVHFTLSTAKQNDINDKNTVNNHYKQITVVMAKQDNIIVLYSLSTSELSLRVVQTGLSALVQQGT